LAEIKKELKLPAVPKELKAMDISNIQGTDAVGSMVVFEDGKPRIPTTGVLKSKPWKCQ